MQPSCHRCGGELPADSSADPTAFCPHCGAPQLFLSEELLAPPATGDATGPQPPPPPLPREIDWSAALSSAAIVAAVAGVLSLLALRFPGVSFVSTVWILTASMTTLTLYLRRRPGAWMDASTGARIGLAAGLLSVVAIVLALAAAGLVARFGLHAMAPFDLNLAQMLAQVKAQAAASSTQPPAEMLHLYDLPEFQAGMMLITLAVAGLFLLLFSTCGGALGGLLRRVAPPARKAPLQAELLLKSSPSPCPNPCPNSPPPPGSAIRAASCPPPRSSAPWSVWPTRSSRRMMAVATWAWSGSSAAAFPSPSASPP